ncbi:YjiH family protein [Natranaerobius trueperi]|uniref:Nucleoside transporter/FeoB GTPase Gate domain-containing protein n=1 Tax=Natranaerobius trueperi TaxID=759412 RepID=A0A226BYJ9_9FIRM|nr:nucleoside recognition domain-containing protein [Natranaerobius trueperi]OWZ84076.1 hypothetical protein CDO51_05010 [Natranaerobius trueperi]
MHLDNNVYKNGVLKFVLGTLIGIFIFFIPVSITDGQIRVPLVIILDFVQDHLEFALDYLVLIMSIMLVVTFLLTKCTNLLPTFKKHHEKDNWIIFTLYLLSTIFSFLVITDTGPEQILHPDVGGLALYLSGSVLLTVTLAGTFVAFLIDFGLVDFLGTLLAPIMRPLYRVPGCSAVDALASFVAAPAVGVFVTNKLYNQKIYTQREASAITTNFSICSIGFFAVLATMGDVLHLFPHIILTSLITIFIMGAIVIRIPPISFKKDVYIDGTLQTQEQVQEENTKVDKQIFGKAVSVASKTAAPKGINAVYYSFWGAAKFAQKILAYVMSITVLGTLIAEYTPFFDYLGMIMVPYLNLFNIPYASEIAASTLVGISELLLPLAIIVGSDISVESVFFVIVLSTVQIIFFTESANAMLEADIPVNFLDLIIIFLIRTVIAIPLVALATHLIF